MQFGLAFGYILNRTGGFANLLLITVCNLIPIVGPIVLLGYRAEVAQALLRDGELRRHPKFDFDRFVEYLTRGVWPFVVGLIVGLAGVGIGLLAFVLGMALGVALNDPLVGAIVAIAGYTFAIVGVLVISTPMTFHAELAGRFDLGEGFRFTVAFWKTVGAQAILAGLIFIPLSTVVAIAGLLLCIVGVYPASSLTQMAGLHVLVQLYILFLERGGEPIRQYQPPDKYDEYDDREDDRDEEDDEEERPRRRRR